MKKKRKQHRRPKGPKPESTAIIQAPKPEMLPSATNVSAIPALKATVENLERVRRFVSMCLNIDLQNAEKKAQTLGKPLPPEERERLEIDWGTIQGVDKPFLKQPGAEKFLFWMQLRPKFINREIILDGGHIEMVSHVVVYHKITKEEFFEGPEASCTTMETNYRYIWAEKDPPPSDAVKEELKLTKMGRHKKKSIWRKGKKIGEKWIFEVRIDNPNIYNERNKVRQMGQKRALVKCVRNMGAISEIFTADPSEWNINPVDVVDVSEDPRDDMDYTPEGRRIVIDGRTPSGNQTVASYEHGAPTPEQQKVLDEKLAHGHPPGSPEAQQANAALQRVEEEDRRLKEAKKPPQPGTKDAPAPPQEAAAGHVEIDWTDKKSPILRGDLTEILDLLKEHCTMTWGADGFWHVTPEDVPAIKALCKQMGFTGHEFIPKKSSGKPEAKPETKTKSAGADPGTHPAPAALTLVNGTLHNTIVGMTKNKSPMLNAKINSAWHMCFVNTIFDYLTKGHGQIVEVWINEKGNIVGLKRVGRHQFDEDGRTPVIQRDREAGGKTLFT